MPQSQTRFFGLRVPFAAHCGVEPVRMGGGQAEFRVALDERHENSLGMAHGGLLLTLLDMALASAARSTLPDDSTVVTVDMQSAFMAPARGVLTAQGRVAKAGRSIIFAEGEVRDAAGEICARATGVFRATAKRIDKPAGGDA